MLQYKWFIWNIMFAFMACQTDTMYLSRQILPNCTWHRGIPLEFSFNVPDTTQAYDVYLLVKNVSDYPYQNLYITYYLQDDQSRLLATELKNYLLFDPKTGKPLGKGWSKSRNHEVLMIKGHCFDHPGIYKLELAQFMRTEILPGICSVGIKLDKASKVIK